tara:strand:+ start:17491 stop:17691 length:201 start_codon:yes stop_codon:yes gene_type:complete
LESLPGFAAPWIMKYYDIRHYPLKISNLTGIVQSKKATTRGSHIKIKRFLKIRSNVKEISIQKKLN